MYYRAVPNLFDVSLHCIPPVGDSGVYVYIAELGDLVSSFSLPKVTRALKNSQ